MFSELSLSICFLYLAFSESTNLGAGLPFTVLAGAGKLLA
jgi:hypothetical protein